MPGAGACSPHHQRLGLSPNTVGSLTGELGRSADEIAQGPTIESNAVNRWQADPERRPFGPSTGSGAAAIGPGPLRSEPKCADRPTPADYEPKNRVRTDVALS